MREEESLHPIETVGRKVRALIKGSKSMKSSVLKKGVDTIPHRALLGASGVKGADLEKPFIGIANSFNDIVPGHVHLNELTKKLLGEYVMKRRAFQVGCAGCMRRYSHVCGDASEPA